MNTNTDYVYQRSYRGRVRAVILDWSGTTADAYVLAPAVVFVDVFRKHGVEISMSEARGPMGLRKDLHIKALAEVPEIAERWRQVHGRPPGQEEAEALFADFVPMQLACLRKYTTLLPGVAEHTRRMQAEGIRIGSTTGFTRAMVDVLEEDAKKQGYVPDASVAGDEVLHGARPKPFMVYRNLDLLDVHPIGAVIKVDDTVSGVGEALEAGCWGVGIARYSNYMDVDSFEHAKSLSSQELRRRLAFTRETLRRAGAHYVIDTIDELPAVIEDVNARLARGEKP